MKYQRKSRIRKYGGHKLRNLRKIFKVQKVVSQVPDAVDFDEHSELVMIRL